MKTLKKIAGITLATLMIAGIAGSAFAEEEAVSNTFDGGVREQEKLGEAVENSISFQKELVIYNTSEAGVTVHEPNVTYTYSIAKVDPNAADAAKLEGVTVTDKTSDHESKTAVTAVVYNGVASAVEFTGYTAAFSSEKTINNVTTAGKVASRTLTLSFTPSEFPHAGIYRYLITETDQVAGADEAEASGRANAGVTSGADYKATRILDVYVRNTDGTKKTNLIYGYVMFEGTADDADDADANITPASEKSNGYVWTPEDDEEDKNNDVDYYNTYNLKVEKKITGTLANKNNEFPFQVVFTGVHESSAIIDYIWNKDGEPQDAVKATISKDKAESTIGTLAETGSVLKLDDEDYVTFYGIPAGTTTTVNEFNNTYDVYSAAVDADGDNNSKFNYDKENVASMTAAKATEAISNNTTKEAIGTADSTVTFTNNMEVISPTGVVMRFAPYALILAAGMVLMVVAMKRKVKREDDED